MNDCGAKSKLPAPLIYLSKTGNYSMPMELLWNDWRDNVTHNHDRLKITELEQDSDRYFARRSHNPKTVLKTIGSPFVNRFQNHKI
jgi:hypothetical protein